ncbi:hypothetical protein QCA50_003557 [Cerrena zonata]|uniref:Uncharacterized protein n=1 Tax=Cerrena zonata TaxID=2478898 RepID=A0AAW0GMX3_9APHY
MPRRTQPEIAMTAVGSKPRRAQAKVAFRKVDSIVDSADEDNNDMDIDGEDSGGDEQMLEMITLLKDFQKRKASVSSARNAAFQSKKNALYEDARKNAQSVVTEGVAYVDQFKTRIAEMKANELSKEQHVKQLSSIMKSLDEPLKEALRVYKGLFEDLSRCRAHEINETSAMLEAHVLERQYSRRRMIKHAKARMDDGLEQQKLATDASNLIKHYKALLRS